jgi:hypothetical protein
MYESVGHHWVRRVESPSNNGHVRLVKTNW